MSRLWSEQLCLAVLPDSIEWTVRARGWRRRIRAHGRIPVLPSPSALPWQPAVETLQQALLDLPIKRGVVSVVLSNAFVRYLIINSNVNMNDNEERLALARHDFQKIHGTSAMAWEIRIASGEASYLAAALDSELLRQLRLCFAATALKLRSITPYLVLAFNHGVKQFAIKEPQGLLLLEPHGYCYAGVRNGQWEFCQSGRWEGSREETCQRVLQREALCSGIAMRCVYLVSAEKVTLDSIMNVQPLPLEDWGALKGQYLMASLGVA